MNICLHRNKTNDEYSCTVKSTVTYISASQKSIIEFSKKSIKFSFWPDQDNSTLQCSVASNVRKFVNDLEIPREIHVIKMFLLGILQTNVIVHANKKKKNLSYDIGEKPCYLNLSGVQRWTQEKDTVILNWAWRLNIFHLISNKVNVISFLLKMFMYGFFSPKMYRFCTVSFFFF